MAHWKVRQRAAGHHEVLADLVADWEVEGDPISDDYTPNNISAEDVLAGWVRRYGRKAERGLVPIYWFVRCSAHGIYDPMPFQHPHYTECAPHENFLAFYDWPVDPKTGTRLNWLTLPVMDKLWNNTRADKGGFIQEATGWKPAILQPFVSIVSLLQGGHP